MAINRTFVDTIKANSAVIRWDSYTPYGYRIKYGTTTSYGNITPYVDEAYFGFNNVTGLLASTTYHYMFELTDVNGVISYSSDYTFTTISQDEVDNLIKAARRDSYTGRVYYVDNSRPNDAGDGLSTVTAWKTLSYAGSKLKAGDMLYLMNSTWTNDQLSLTNDGIDIAPITVKNYFGANPLLVVDNKIDTIQLKLKNYWIFDGLTVNQNGGFSLRGSHNILRNSWIYGNIGSEVTNSEVQDSWNILEYSKLTSAVWNVVQLANDITGNTRAVRYITIRGVEVYEANLHSSIDLAGNFDFVTIDNFWTHDSKNPDIYPHDASKGNATRYLTIKNNKFDGILGVSSYEGVPLHDAIIVGAAIFNNIFCNYTKEYCIRTLPAEGQAIEKDVYIYNNTGYNCTVGLIYPGSSYSGSNNKIIVGTPCPPLSVTPEWTTGILDVSSFPRGAEIFIDTVDQGKITRSVIQNIPIGSHTLKLTLAGYQDYTTTFTITGGATTTLSPTLTQVQPTTGILDVSSSPRGAEIFIDTVDQGKITRSVIQNIPIGSHTLKLTLAGYQDYTTTFTITGGATTTLSPTLTQVQPTIGELITYFPFDDSGNIAYDASGNGNSGSVYNGIRVPGMSGYAISFRSGVNSYVEVPKSSSLDSINKQITIDVWVNSPIGVRGTIVERWSYSPTANRSYVLVLETNGAISFMLSPNGSYPASGTGILVSNSKVLANKWTHIVATSDGTTMKIYMDGVQDTNTAIAPPGGIYVPNAPLHIGTWMYSIGTPSTGFVGLIDEFKIYTKALTQIVLISITLSPAQATLQVGQSQVFTATALDRNGNTVENVTLYFVHTPDNSTGSMLPMVGTTDLNGNFTSTFTSTAPGISMVQAMNLDGSVKSAASMLTVRSIPSTGYVLFFPFDDSGNIAYDASGNGNSGSVYNGIRVPGMSGYAISFRSGVNSYVEVPKSSSLDSINKQITIDVWINSPIGARGTIAERWLYSPTANRSYVLVLETNGAISFMLSPNGSYPASGTGILVSNSKVLANKWTHIVATSDGATMKIYMDGVQDTNTAIAPPGGIYVPNAPLHIGTWMYSTGTPSTGFVGLIDEFKLLNNSLSTGV